MEATVGGSCGIKPDPSLKTGREEENPLIKWFLILKRQERDELERDKARITQVFLRKIKHHEDGKSEGEDVQVDTIPKLSE